MKATHILWEGIEERSLEHCAVTRTAKGFFIGSKITGLREGMVFDASYEIFTNKRWETSSFRVECNSSKGAYIVAGERSQGHWIINGIRRKEFNPCIDIDIPLTPFTNTLPINRLQLQTGEEAFVQIIYLDMLRQKVSKVRQKYTRLSGQRYRYENVPNDFEAVVTVDKEGLVKQYQHLFRRVL